MIAATDDVELVRSRVALLGPPDTWAGPLPAAAIVPAMLDAVWSIANRRGVVRNVVQRYAEARSAVGEDAERDTPAHLAVAIRASGGPEAFAEVIANRQRTGARGCLRTDALLQLADTLAAAGVSTSADARAASPDALDRVRAGWTTVSGQRSGISWDRFLLLCDVPQPTSDAMVRRFVARALGRADTDGVSGVEAAGLMGQVATGIGTTRRQLEAAVWRYEMEGGDGLAEARRRKAAGSPTNASPSIAAAVQAPESKREAPAPQPGLLDVPLVRGVAGASARREHERRRTRREQTARHDNPLVAALLRALQDEPQCERAWSKGAEGEETVGRSLEKRCDPGVILLHDRRIPGTRANIDHLAIGSAGVWVIDTKHYAGKATVEKAAGRTRLKINGRDCSKLIEKLAAQVALVTAAAADVERGIPVHGALCMVGTDLPLLRTLSFGGFQLLYPKALARQVSAAGPLADRRVQKVAKGLAGHFGPA